MPVYRGHRSMVTESRNPLVCTVRRAVMSALFVLPANGAVSPDVRAATVTVWFYRGDVMFAAQRTTSTLVPTAEEAVRQLVAGPTAIEAAAGVSSAIPLGTEILGIVTDATSAAIDFSASLLTAGVDEVVVESVFRQVNWTVRPFGADTSVALTVEGQPLSSYLPPKPRIVPRPIRTAAAQTAAASLAGHSVTVSPGHGYMWSGSTWATQRPIYCSPLNQEDFHNLEMCQYLEKYLVADGATVRMARCTDMNYGYDSVATGTHIASNKPWWQCAGYLWIQKLGYPCSVYASYTGDCTTGSGGSESNDDVRSRPLMSDQDGTDIYVSMHTNGYAGDCTGAGCPTGTETYYDAGSEHAAWGAVSLALANNINSSITNAIAGHVDPTWTCHGTCVKNSNGNYGEIRIPDRAATLTELGFHDTCDRDADANHLRDGFFRSAAMWGMYKGICTYFGKSPTWDIYSAEYVNDTIPATMTAGATYNVTVTYRNRGAVWKAARAFRLGAVDDSDPFTSFNRVGISGEVGPGDTYTFAFAMTPPAAGTFVTDWRMVRDGVTWFGTTLSKTVVVNRSVPADVDGDLDVDLDDFSMFQICFNGPNRLAPYGGCGYADFDGDGDVDLSDFGFFQLCYSGPNRAPPCE